MGMLNLKIFLTVLISVVVVISISRMNLAQVALAQSHGVLAQKLSDTEEHHNEDDEQAAYESDKDSAAGRQKHASSAITHSVQPESPTSEGIILIHPKPMIMQI